MQLPVRLPKARSPLSKGLAEVNLSGFGYNLTYARHNMHRFDAVAVGPRVFYIGRHHPRLTTDCGVEEDAKILCGPRFERPHATMVSTDIMFSITCALFMPSLGWYWQRSLPKEEERGGHAGRFGDFHNGCSGRGRKYYG
jgi:hypothetical protein